MQHMSANQIPDCLAVGCTEPDQPARAYLMVIAHDPEGVRLGAPAEILGASAVAAVFAAYTGGVQPALVGGLAGAVWAPGGRTRVAYVFTVADGTITAINRVAHPERLRELDPVLLEG